MVKASGVNSRPDTPSSVNTGMNDTVITSSEKKIEGPTSCIAEMIVSTREVWRPPRSQSSSFLWMFSMMMIEASTIAPIATAIPPSDMILAVRCCAFIGMNASRTPRGSVRIGMIALRTWSRNRKMMAATTIISSISV